MTSAVAITFLLLVWTQVPIGVLGHGLLVNPTTRISLRWSDIYKEYLSLGPDRNGDNGQACGNRPDGVGILQKDDPGSNCGVCGDDFTLPMPRPNEHGGKFDRGIITARYLSGQVIAVDSLLSNPHYGTLEWRLCTDVKRETQECFNEYVLPIEDPHSVLFTPTKINVTTDRRVPCTPPCTGWRTDLFLQTKVRLPKGVTCEHCVLQWNYRAGRVEKGDDGVKCRGCGPQETFRSCADIRIVSYITLFKNVQTQNCFSRTADNHFELVPCNENSVAQYIDVKQDFEKYKTTPFYVSMYEPELCLDVEARGVHDGATVIPYKCNGQVNQKWSFDFVEGKADVFQIKGLTSGKCLTPTGRVGKGSMEIRTCDESATNQLWEVIRKPIPEGVLNINY